MKTNTWHKPQSETLPFNPFWSSIFCDVFLLLKSNPHKFRCVNNNCTNCKCTNVKSCYTMNICNQHQDQKTNPFFFFFYCCSITVVPIIPLLSSALPTSISHIKSYHRPCCLWPWVLCTCSLMTLPFLSSIIPLYPPLWSLSVCFYFYVSGSILLPCLFCWFDSIYRWDYMVFVFHHLAYFT